MTAELEQCLRRMVDARVLTPAAGYGKVYQDLATHGCGLAHTSYPAYHLLTSTPGGMAMLIVGRPGAVVLDLDVAYDLPDHVVAALRATLTEALVRCGIPFIPVSFRALSRILPMSNDWPKTRLVDGDTRQCVLATPDGTHYISGFDANEVPPLYFCARLPHAVGSYAEAIEALKPPSVKLAEAQGLTVLRQGDMFAIATEYETPDLEDLGAVFSTEVTRERRRLGDPIERLRSGGRATSVGGRGGAVREAADELMADRVTRRRGLYGTAHTATELAYLPDGTMFARGTIRHDPARVLGESRDPDHHRLPLPGENWWLIARNTVPIVEGG